MDEPTINVTVIMGMILIILSLIVQLTSLLIMRILSKLKPYRHTVTLRMWLFLATSLDQIAFLVFHIKYHFMETDFKDTGSCIVLRFVGSFTSTFTVMWLSIIAAFYCILTIKPAKCFTFHSRFLSHCVTWTWTCVSCLMYLVMAFLLKEEQHVKYLYPCWNSINGTIHLYLTYGNEIFGLFLVLIYSICARFRMTSKRERVDFFLQHPQYKDELYGLKSNINILIFLSFVLCVYYVGIVLRYRLETTGSDLYLMALQSFKGLIISVMMCFLDKRVMDLLRCRIPIEQADDTQENGINFTPDMHFEMNTFAFE